MFPPPDSVRRDAIVLVHGAWVGEWCWHDLATRLRARGRVVHTVSLRGHGTRRAEGGPHVGLADHVDDLVAVLETHDLGAATLVAHSYGGRVLTRAWPRIASRAARLVYLDAHAPVGPPDHARHLITGLSPATNGMVPIDGFAPDAELVGGPAGLRWFLDRVAPQSMATLREPFWVDLPPALPKVYVRATANHDGRFDAYAEAARTHPDWIYREIPGDHWLLYSHPEAVVDAIIGRAGESRPGEPTATEAPEESPCHRVPPS